MTPFKVMDMMFGGGLLPPLKVIWNPVVMVVPAAALMFQAVFEKVQLVGVPHFTLAPFHTC